MSQFLAALPAWPQRRARVGFERATSGIRRHTFTGPPVKGAKKPPR